MADSGSTRTPPGPSWRLALALLGVTAVVIVVTVVLIVRPERPPVPQVPVARDAVGPERIIANARSLMEADPSVPAPLAETALNQAIDLMRAYLNAHPDQLEVQLLLAEAQLKAGALVAAERTAARALELEPDRAASLWMRGQILRHRGDESCVEFYRRAAEAGDAEPRMWREYGLLLAGAGRTAEARKYLQKAVDAGDKDRAARVALGRIALDGGEYERAAELLAGAIDADEQDPQSWRALAAAQHGSGRTADAVRTLRRGIEAIRRWSNKALLSVELGELLESTGSDPEAAEVFAEASDAMPRLAEPALAAARAYYRMGRYAPAMKYIDRAAAIRAGDEEIRLWVRRIEDARFVASGAERPAKRRGRAD